jgi:PPE-repeat protein
MAGLYPDDETLEIFGETLLWPGLDPVTGKFTNGSFSDPLTKPSAIPAETINLILDNLAALITKSGDTPNNDGITQLANLFTSVAAPKRGVMRDVNGRAKVAAPAADDDIARKAEVDAIGQALLVAIATLVDSSPLDTLQKLAAAIDNDANFAATMANALATKAPLASPVLTGIPTAPTAEENDNSLTIANTQWVRDYLFRIRPIAKYGQYAVQPSAAELIMRRELPCEYQIIEIALYQDLCTLKYCGDSLNASADWWYKCNASGTRSTSGLYMRVEDARGLFHRGYGTNAVKTMANGTPYNGLTIGAFQKDGMMDLPGALSAGPNANVISVIAGKAGIFKPSTTTRGYIATGPSNSGMPDIISLDISQVIGADRVINEFRVANISVFYTISY